MTLDGVEYELVPVYSFEHYNLDGTHTIGTLMYYGLKPLHGEIDLSDKDTDG